MKRAFTLAETLIAIAIIGVVAAITIPSCLSHYKKLETTSKLKKFYSTMEKAVQLAEYENGLNVRQFDTGVKYTGVAAKSERSAYDDYTVQERYDMVLNYWLQYFAPYIPYIKTVNGTIEEDGYTTADETDESSGTRPAIHLLDGSIIYLWLGACVDVLYDVNGEEGPNEYGRDQYFFYIATSYTHSWDMPEDVSFYPAALTSTSTRTGLLKDCANNGKYCAALLAFDNWEFKSDYPYKL